MGKSTARLNLATSLFLTRLLPLTTGCLLVSMNPSEARGGDDSARSLRHHNGGRVHQARNQSLNPFQNGFTPAFNAHVQRNTTGVDTRRFDLDLSSAARNIELGSRLFDGAGSVTIDVGGSNKNFSAGDQVTAAEYVAIQQVLSQSQQSINVSAQGAAYGGSFSLSQPAGTRIGNLVVPQNVAAVNNFSSNRSVNLSGDLTNLGSIYGLSTSNRARSGVISADDINNSGTITSDLSDSFLSSLGGTVKHFDLTVVAERNLNNSGSISSSGALTVATASGAISNSGAVTAKSDLNVFAGNGNLHNSGVINAQNGNLNIAASQVATDLNIDGASGTFAAQNGDINVRDASYTDANDTTMLGGTYLSDKLNVSGGGGTITTFVDEVSGDVYTTGLNAHVMAQNGTLNLGDNCLTGDPTFANATGNIVINGALIAREDITILAAGNITATGNAFISTANSIGQATVPSTNITLVAGAPVTLAGGAVGTTGMPTPGTPIGVGTASVTFTGGLGGNIDFTGSKFLGFLINSSSNGGGALTQTNGGDVILVAHSTSTSNGFIKFPDARLAIDTTSLGGDAGDVTIIAGNNSAASGTPAITIGTIKAQADTASGGTNGNVLVYAAAPESTTGAPIVWNPDGSRQGAVDFQTTPALLAFTGSFIKFTGSIFAEENPNGGNITAITNGGLLQTGTGRLQGEIVTLTAGLGGIGSGTATKATRLLTEANVLVLNSGGNIFINNLGSVAIGNATTPGALAGNLGTIDISTTPDGIGAGAISVPFDGIVQASGAGLLSVINLTAAAVISASGNISTQNNALLEATTVNLATINPADGVKGLGFGDIGTNAGANSINTDATSVSANTQGDVFVNNTGEVTILASSAGHSKTFNVQTTPDGGTGNGSITIGDIIGANVGRIGTLLLASSENGAGIGGIIPGGTLIAADVTLRDDNNVGTAGLGTASIGTAAAPITVDTSALTTRTLGAEINIKNVIKTGMDLLQVNTNANRSGSFTLTSASTINVSNANAVFVIDSVTLTAQGTGNILLNNNIDLNGAAPLATLTTSSGSITGNGSGIFDSGAAPVALSVVFNSTSGGVGTDQTPIFTGAINVTSNAVGFTNIYNQDPTAVTLVASAAKNQLTFFADGPITVTAPILGATGISLRTSGLGDNINLNSSIGGSKATSFVEIITAGGGSILQAPLTTVAAKVLVSLGSFGSNIGAIGAPIVVSTPGLSATALGLGLVNISALATKKVPLVLYNSGAGTGFSLTALGSLVLNNIQTINGSITVSTTAGLLSTNPNAIIQIAQSGSPAGSAAFITLRNTATKVKGASISIGTGSTIATFVNTPGTGPTGAGAINIQTTAGAPTQINTTLPANVVLGPPLGGTTFFGANSITALAPNNTMENVGADITFDSGTLPSTAILLGGNVLIHADPPVTGSAPVISNAAASSPVVISGAGLAPRTIPPADRKIDNGLAQLSSTSTGMPSLDASIESVPAASFNDFSNLATALANRQNALSFATTTQPGWMSDTELVNGEIPASIMGNEDMDIVDDDLATVDFEISTSVPQELHQSGSPLRGEVSKNVVCDEKNLLASKQTTLRRGTVLFAPTVDTEVTTPVGKIKIGARSLALVMACVDGIAVYDLDDVRKGAIEVTAAGNSMTLSPGQHVFITRDSVGSFDEINPAQMIGYRGITSRNLGSGLKAFSAEFCVPHAIHAVKPLKNLLQSRHPQSRKVADHLIKTTAAVMQLRGNGGAYQQVFRPRKTAWVN